jgi:hypothetical protein
MNQPVLVELPKNYDLGCAEIMKMAERELAAYVNAVTLFGAKQAQLAARDWMQELETINALPLVPREWRAITINAAGRRATRLLIQRKRRHGTGHAHAARNAAPAQAQPACHR